MGLNVQNSERDLILLQMNLEWMLPWVSSCLLRLSEFPKLIGLLKLHVCLLLRIIIKNNHHLIFFRSYIYIGLPWNEGQSKPYLSLPVLHVLGKQCLFCGGATTLEHFPCEILSSFFLCLIHHCYFKDLLMYNIFCPFCCNSFKVLVFSYRTCLIFFLFLEGGGHGHSSLSWCP